MSMSTRVWIESEQITNTALEMIALQLVKQRAIVKLESEQYQLRTI